MGQIVEEQISRGDWEATPLSVRNLLLSLERERDVVREQLERLKREQDANSGEYKRRLERYHALVEQQFLTGLTLDLEQEIERLGQEIDSVNGAFYPSLASLL